ncbi:hypothetical protein [Actinoplanes sp. M2I2]|uniref:hypothetical protein n=1 Tax=Actinoplanes sp. M2I2 TaxID=1734444 RepID=UPI0020202CC9|nr:hypothetical protein [Actinoplanes sp. M2I2]
MRRLAGAVLTALLAALVPAAAAHAAPLTWAMTMGQESVPPGGRESLPLSYRVAGAGNDRQKFDLVFDITATRDLVTVSLPGSACVTTATTVSCPASGLDASIHVTVAARSGAPVGTTMRLPGRIVQEGRTVAGATGTITIAEQVTIAAIDAQDNLPIASGATAGLAAGVRNTGDKPVTGVIARLRTANGIRPAEYANCVPVEAPYQFPPASGAVCLFDEELAPGRSYRLKTPLRVTVTDQVWAPSGWYSSFTWWTTQDFLDQGGELPTGGSGPRLELADAPTARAVPQTEPALNGDNDDDWTLLVTGRNASTFTVEGDTVSGRVGQTVTVRTSVRNNGPARLEGTEQPPGSSMIAVVTPPRGTTIVKHSKSCHPFSIGHPAPYPPFPLDAEIGDGKVYCWPGDFFFPSYLPGRTYTYDITLRITEPGTLRGDFTTLLADAGTPAGPDRQRAAIVVDATAPAAGNGGEGGGLPITGSNSPAVALIGLTLLIAGAVARIATRGPGRMHSD